MSAPGSGWLRRAGTGRLADGSIVTWSVAEGGRGRRWRWTVVAPDGALRRVTLLEFDREGRFSRLELETADGMLTFHPEADHASAHGNVVRRHGVDPIAIDRWDAASIAVEGDPFGTAVAGGQGRSWVVAVDLAIRSATDTAITANEVLAVDDRGVPLLADASEWPLED